MTPLSHSWPDLSLLARTEVQRRIGRDSKTGQRTHDRVGQAACALTCARQGGDAWLRMPFGRLWSAQFGVGRSQKPPSLLDSGRLGRPGRPLSLIAACNLRPCPVEPTSRMMADRANPSRTAPPPLIHIFQARPSGLAVMLSAHVSHLAVILFDTE